MSLSISIRVFKNRDRDSASSSSSTAESAVDSTDSGSNNLKTPTAGQRLLGILRYVPARCRYDPTTPFEFTFALNLLFAFAATFTVANLYYNHPILDKMAETFNVSYERVAVVPTLMQAGYASGLLFLNPLGDLFRRRALVLVLILFTTLCWVALCVTRSFEVFAAFSFVVAVSTVTPQLMLPLVGDLAPPAKRATALSYVTSGILLGMLLARILSGIITQFTHWRTVYYVALGLQALIFVLLYLFMPDYPSTNPSGLTYTRSLLSLFALAKAHPTLVQAALIGLCVSAVFTTYWTTLTFLLIAPPYGYSSLVVGLFGLIGVAAIFLAPLVGRFVIDRHTPSLGLLLGLLVVLAGQVVGCFGGLYSVAAPVLQAFLVDLGIQTTQVSNRTAIYRLDAGARNRVNSVYMLGVFFGQVVGTASGAPLLHRYGWKGSAGAGVGFAGLALVVLAARAPGAGWVGWKGGWGWRGKTEGASGGGGAGGGAQPPEPGVVQLRRSIRPSDANATND
ncbi:MFS general substrate transporter [Morchella conica CCBAS932]|uniref:MFS general substrate transporter n=1 Tax=Morchella conica CCBAS932 TaxID=1392247 RepID=A0A3N4KM18_9PEZI|nr:MFS general substrate transporter [Morchella conica CCBAS932]